jgi:glycosyltransferase involved in cell wall biosynthesis
VDEIIVVDTGSKDRTPEICQELGARVEHFPWCDDFSAARNESLNYATGEWIFWMDSDDTIPPECGRKLRKLVEGEHADSCLGYVMQVHCPGTKPDDLTVVDHVKLFRNHPDLRFEFRIHEQILPAIRRAGGEVGWTDLHVVHSGSDHSSDGQKRKLERDFRILKQDLAERPDHPFVLFNLGMTCSEAHLLDDAKAHLERCLEVSLPTESHVRKAYAILVAVLMRQEQHHPACVVCEKGLALFPDDRELLFRRAMLHHSAGRLIEAREDYLTILRPQTERHFSSRDIGILGYKARHNLAIVYEDLGDFESGRMQWSRILEERPGYAPARRALQNLRQTQM